MKEQLEKEIQRHNDLLLEIQDLDVMKKNKEQERWMLLGKINYMKELLLKEESVSKASDEPSKKTKVTK